MALPILMVGAVPFAFPENSLASRRRRRRCPCGSRPQTANCSQQTDSAVDPRVVMVVMNEAAEAIQTVLGGRHRQLTLPAPPPNSPASSSITFEFDFVNKRDGLSTSSDEEDEVRLRQQARQMRKRRRVPSFKTLQQPRVVPKMAASEADDEASDDDDDVTKTADLVADKVDSAESITEKADRTESDEIVTTSELQLKLQVLSETQRTLGEESADWTKVGEELRAIADNFQRDFSNEDEVDGNQLMAIVNEMLPFAIPQSLWSAIISYAAWKIFKRFQ